jgi:hypothetical protein
MFAPSVWRYLPRSVTVRQGSIADDKGTAWHEYQPPTDKKKSFELLDAYVAAGGNVIDTANGYSVCPTKDSRLMIG